MNLSLFKKLKAKELPLYFSFLFFLLFSANGFSQEGKALFKQNCASCHHPLKNGTGPALQGAKAKWEGAGDDITKWVKNPQSQIDAGVSSAIAIESYSATQMPAQAVNDEEIASILEYVEGYTPPPTPVGVVAATGATGGTESNNSWLMWLIIGGVLSMLIVALWGVRKQLFYAVTEKDSGEEVTEEESLKEEVQSWIGRNMKLVSVLAFILVCVLAYNGAEQLYKVGLIPENYNPDQPIAFDHSIHAGTNEIDCQYCHNSASKSKSAGIPTVNVCMNCHKGIQEASSGEKGTKEIAKIHAAAGFDPTQGAGVYTGKTEPIKWVKVHNMPDHVYFNHSQHVTVGGIECENCHGDVKTYTTGKVSGTETINNITLPDNRKIIKLSKPLLTMGWCIECHNTAEVSTKDNKYYDEIHERLKMDKELYKSVYEDGKVKVKELGGWECSKCHY